MPRVWFWIGLAASLALLAYQRKDKIVAVSQDIATGVTDMLTPRGIRNNNPGNIRHGTSKWQGMANDQTDPAFVQFVTPEYGIRALSKILDSYDFRGLHTVRSIISTYAPGVENDTGAYVQAVADELGVSPDQTLYVPEKKTELIAAIIRHENGQQPYALAQIETGVMMA